MTSRRFLAALPLVALALTACGASEPDNSPAAGRSAAPGAVSEPVMSPSATCWTDPGVAMYAPEWLDHFNLISADPSASLAFLDSLPDPSEGCSVADSDSLRHAQEIAGRVRERFPTAG